MSDWISFLQEVEDARKSLSLFAGEEIFYRGHGDCRWPLFPTLLRHQKQKQLTNQATRELERDLFFEFRARARELHQYGLTDWEVLQFMRHHGVATRLLDWSEVFGVALYFALNDAPLGATPCIWLLNPYTLNEDAGSLGGRELMSPEYMDGEDEIKYSDYMNDVNERFWWKHPISLYPEQRSARLHAQRGYFTVHGSAHQPLEELVKDAVRRVDIPVEAVPDARRFLELAGITHHLLFPDLDGLARELHRKNGIR